MSLPIRFAFFVDGSNLFGSMKHLDLQVKDYEAFYLHVMKCAVETWRHSLSPPNPPMTQLRRVYWYEVGAIDDWDLDSLQTQAFIQTQFNSARLVKADFMAQAAKKIPSKDQRAIAKQAWEDFYSECKAWYQDKKETLSGMKRFHYGVMSGTDFIDIRAVAHWKVDFVDRSLSEKGLDTALAVDMVALRDNYDIAIVISGDADNLPGMQYVQEQNKMVGVVEFIRGTPPELRGKSTSNRLKLRSDFVVQVFESDLLKDKVAARPPAKT
jgi:uncharacterized LabA/DUF88 family protein